MTILHDECKPIKHTSSDAVRDLLKHTIAQHDVFSTQDEVVESILSALSDAGLAVRPIKATEEMIEAADVTPPGEFHPPDITWDYMQAAFRPSQLEKTDE